MHISLSLFLSFCLSLFLFNNSTTRKYISKESITLCRLVAMRPPSTIYDLSLSLGPSYSVDLFFKSIIDPFSSVQVETRPENHRVAIPTAS
jgi:hypothetical protein